MTVDWSSAGAALQSAWNAVRDFSSLSSGPLTLEEAALNWDAEQYRLEHEGNGENIMPYPTYDPGTRGNYVERYQEYNATKAQTNTQTKTATDSVSPQRGITVIGNYPDNKNLAILLHANWLNLPDGQWSWEVNKAWLNAAIARGDEIVLATRVDRKAIAGTTYGWEIAYLESLGYKVSEDGTYLIPPP